MKAVSNKVLGPLRVWLYSGRNMFNSGSTAGCSISRTTIINVDVSPKVRTVEVAHCRGAVIIDCDLVSIDLEGSLIWSFN